MIMQEHPPSRRLRVVTINSHQPYLFNLNGLAHDFTIIDQGLSGFGCQWNYGVRPLPDHFRLVSQAEAVTAAQHEPFDVGLAHNITDLLALKDVTEKLVLLIHCSLPGRLANEASHTRAEDFVKIMERYLEHVPARIVYVSALKAETWGGLNGVVIEHGIQPELYTGYSGENPAVLRVSNMQRQRDVILNHTLQQVVLNGIPNQLFGWNPDVPGATCTSSWEHLKDIYRQYRCFLLTNHPEMEDGYNLAALEAMATGMPVVTTPHATSPIRHGENGFVGETVPELRQHLGRLLQDAELARRLGAAARRTVQSEFSYVRFLASWDMLLRRTAADPATSAPEYCSHTESPAQTGAAEPLLASEVDTPRLTLIPGGRPESAGPNFTVLPRLRTVTTGCSTGSRAGSPRNTEDDSS
ncbi:MAG: glycosyltransferase [bacterium]